MELSKQKFRRAKSFTRVSCLSLDTRSHLAILTTVWRPELGHEEELLDDKKKPVKMWACKLGTTVIQKRKYPEVPGQFCP